MNRKPTAEQVLRQMDPAAQITDAELAHSRNRSLAAVHAASAAAQETDGVAALGRPGRPSPATSELPVRRSRRPRIWLTSAAAAAVVAALIGGDVIGLAGWRGGATAQAAEVLNSAAQTTISTTDPVVKAGQYLKIRSTNVWSTAYATTPGTSFEWLDTEKSEMYVPADRSNEWVWRRSGRIPTTFFSAASEKFVREQNIRPTPELLRAPNGAFYGGPGFAPDMAGFPRDPYRLLNSIYKQTLGKGQSVDGEAVVFIADLLRTGVVPADLRAALYKAAAMIPGVSVTEGQANLDGRTGVAIGRTEEAGVMRQEIIIDPKTGQLIGERSILTERLGSMPAGTAVTWTAVETSVSNTAP